MDANSSWDMFWWAEITGPHVFATKVIEAIRDDRMIAIIVPPDVSWLNSMRSTIQDAFKDKTKDTNVLFQELDCIEDNPEGLEPGKLILKRFGKEMVFLGYREKTPIHDYISKNEVLKNTVVWIKGLRDKNAAEQWIKFCRGFKKRTKQDGLVILEIQDDIPSKEMNPLEVIIYNDCVSNYDVQLFNRFVLGAQKKYSDIWKYYIASVSASVCDIDAELSAALIETTDFKKWSVIDGLNHLADSEDYSEHVLKFYENLKDGDADIEHRVWRAQVQTLFPIIELERVTLINKWNSRIQWVLDNYTISQFNVLLKDASHTELGALYYIITKYPLCIQNKEDCDWITFLHDCRNQLAHAKCCTPDQVKRLLDITTQKNI